MTAFVCDDCECVDLIELTPPQEGTRMLCSACHPSAGGWHGHFEKKQYNKEVDVVCNAPTGLGLEGTS